MKQYEPETIEFRTRHGLEAGESPAARDYDALVKENKKLAHERELSQLELEAVRVELRRHEVESRHLRNVVLHLDDADPNAAQLADLRLRVEELREQLDRAQARANAAEKIQRDSAVQSTRLIAHGLVIDSALAEIRRQLNAGAPLGLILSRLRTIARSVPVDLADLPSGEFYLATDTDADDSPYVALRVSPKPGTTNWSYEVGIIHKERVGRAIVALLNSTRLGEATPLVVDAVERAAQAAQAIVDRHEDLKKPGSELQAAAIAIREACEEALDKMRQKNE